MSRLGLSVLGLSLIALQVAIAAGRGPLDTERPTRPLRPSTGPPFPLYAVAADPRIDAAAVAGSQSDPPRADPSQRDRAKTSLAPWAKSSSRSRLIAIAVRDAGAEPARRHAPAARPVGCCGAAQGLSETRSVAALAARGARAAPPDLARAEFPPPIESAARDRVLDDLGLTRESLLDPYGINTIKGDRPIFGRDWFLAVEAEARAEIALGRVPAGSSVDPRSAATGTDRARTATQSLGLSLSLTKGSTVFRPPDLKLRAAVRLTRANDRSLVARAARRAEAARAEGVASPEDASGVELSELYLERHLRNRSDRYDFDSVRIGLQPLISDYRGLLLGGAHPGIRLFGNRDNNVYQYNLAAFRRLARDPRTGLARAALRDDLLLVANLYRQDAPVLGLQVQGTLVYYRDRTRGDRELSTALRAMASRRAEIDAVYLGWSGDGHVDRLNVTFSSYLVAGRTRRGGSDASGPEHQEVRAYFGALETSLDFDWYRLKAYAILASGDSDPDDGRAEGFDAIGARPVFGGLESSFFQSESLAVGMGRRLLSERGGFLPSLRAIGDEDAASFSNPGLRALGIGVDAALLPELRLRANAVYLELASPRGLSGLAGGRSVGRELGRDFAIDLEYRPLLSNNITIGLTGAALLPGRGLDRLLGGVDRDVLWSARASVTLRY